ncbi:helix-turn-helix transcriptional regulator [Luteimonas sp. MJ250]|uniref:helix-turn-helix domain-containing protein n=1 Tax=Luteimonas sp. MJ250 TaxID=3129236 RepID=UPI0031BBBD41
MPTKTIYSPKYRRFVESLRTLREKAGISQSKLSLQLGWPQQRLSAIEAGARRLDVMEFLQLTGALGLSPEEGIRIAAGAAEPPTKASKPREPAQ